MRERDNRNIYGQSGCNRPDGGLCNGPCCVKYKITLGDLNEGPFKQAFSPCPHMGEEGGCDLHNKGTKPFRCGQYHCSVESLHDKISLIGGALAMGDISPDEALDAASLWSDKSENELKDMIDSAAREFSEKVKERELIYVEFDQP